MTGTADTSLALLDDRYIAFPPTYRALRDPNGLLALGGDLTPPWLLAAYRHGIFPWFADDQPILWWSPSPRCVVLPDQFRIGRSLRKVLRREDFHITFDRAFDRVVDACRASRADTEGTWITPEMREAYIHMHRLGYAHSVEAWCGEELVGGLYGLAVGRIFFGESMFHRASNASKVAFVHLIRQLELWGCPLVDCQVSNPHLISMGAVEMPRTDFEQILRVGIDMPDFPSPWSLSWSYE